MQISTSEFQLNTHSNASSATLTRNDYSNQLKKTDLTFADKSKEKEKLPSSLFDPVHLQKKPSSLTTYDPESIRIEASRFAASFHQSHTAILEDFQLPGSKQTTTVPSESKTSEITLNSNPENNISDEQMDSFLRKAFRLFDSEP